MSAADAAFARRHGVSEDVVQRIRKSSLTEGAHWARQQGGMIVYTPAGLAELAMLLGAEKKEGAAAAGASRDAPEVRALPISKIFPNRIWVRVITPEGRAADVRVRDNTRLRPLMRLPCVEHLGKWHCAAAQHGVAPEILELLSSAAPAEKGQTNTGLSRGDQQHKNHQL